LMIVVRIADVQSNESFSVGVLMVTPSGVSLSPRHADSFDITVTGEYIFITLRDIPLKEEGLYRFAVSVGKGDPISIDVPVRLVRKRTPKSGSAPHKAGHAIGQSQWRSDADGNEAKPRRLTFLRLIIEGTRRSPWTPN